MSVGYVFPVTDSWIAILKCGILAISYVGSLYLKKSPYPRDHPATIRQRIKSVTVVCLLAPLFLFSCCTVKEDEGYQFIKWLGVNVHKIFPAILLPVILTIILFMGPIFLYLIEDGLADFKANFMVICNSGDLVAYRTYVVAPFTEEFIFRACMLPILVPNFGLFWSIVLAPLFFGVAHFHHVIEQLQLGHELVPVIMSSLFQMLYTTVFGMYSAFLFLRTGHLIGPILCHSFCNLMGFPQFEMVPSSKYPKFISLSFVIGLFLFIYLLFPLTDPIIYESIYWK